MSEDYKTIASFFDEWNKKASEEQKKIINDLTLKESKDIEKHIKNISDYLEGQSYNKRVSQKI